MRKKWMGAAAVFAAIAFVLAVTGCAAKSGSTPPPAQKKGPVVVGSKIDTEGGLLAAIIKIKLENAGFTVTDKSQTGTTDVVRKALLTGDIDIYPEYTGNGLVFFKGQDPAVYKDPQRGYDAVKKLDLEQNKIVWLTPAKANNTWAICARKDFAEKNKISTMSEFVTYFKGGGQVKLAASDEFFNNPDAFPAFESAYGFKLTADQQLVVAGGNTAQTERAVADGTSGVNFGMAYGTDGALADLGLVVLTDDKSAQVVYWPTPIVRKAVLDKYPDIATALKPVFESLTLEKLQELNARIQVNGEATDAVAKDYLSKNGFTK
jgi:osmoprotectant transport system substrate-binding protein